MTGGYIGGISSLDRGTGYYTKEEANATFYKIGDDTGIIHTQRFIGSSSTREYVMARTPINKNNTQVYINGAYQNKETYNVTSNILTLGDYPIDGQEIEVVIVASITHYTQDMSPHNLEYHPVGDGTPVISIEDKLRSIAGFVDHAKQDSLISNLYNISGVHDSVLFVSGFWEHADGGGGIFFWDSQQPKDTHNGGTIIDPVKCCHLAGGAITEEYFIPDSNGNGCEANGEGYGCWKRVYSNEPNLKWFGAVGDGEVDDTVALQYAINHTNYSLRIPDGVYLVSGTEVRQKKKLILDNNATVKLADLSNKHMFLVDSSSIIESFELIGGILDGSRIVQTTPVSAINTTAKYNKVFNCEIRNFGLFGIEGSDVCNVDSVRVNNTNTGISYRPSRTQILEQVSITGCDIEVDKIGVEILRSTDNQPRYESVLIENNSILVSDYAEAAVSVSCKRGLRFANNVITGGKSCYFSEGIGGIITGNAFNNQITSIEIDNYSTLNVTDNHLNGGDMSNHAITHTSNAQTFNNVYMNNHIEGYSTSCGFFSDENNEILFSGNTCHDSPLIISGACDYSITNNQFMGAAIGLNIRGTRCSAQSGSIIGNKFSSNTTAIDIEASSGLAISRMSIIDNIFTNSGTCIRHNKNYGSIDDVTVMHNTFNNYITLFTAPTISDIPSSLYWKDNKGDTISVTTTSDLEHGDIIFGEKYALYDTNNLTVRVRANNYVMGQQLKLSYNGSTNPINVVVPRYTRPNETFVLNSEFQYLILEWSGREWHDITSRYGTEDYPGLLKLASSSECFGGEITTKAVTPSGLRGIINDNETVSTHTWSSEKIQGKSEEDIQNAIDSIPYATTSVAGLIKLSTLQEAQEGVNTDKAITPVGLRGLLHDDEISNLFTWSSTKIHDEIQDFSGIILRDKSDGEEECPLLFTDKQANDKVREMYITAPQLFYVASRGSLNSVVFNSLSDNRYKKNIKTIETSLDIINQLRGVKFDWKHSDDTSYGVIAQELEKVIPDLVSTSPESGMKNVNYDGIIGFLIEAIKELSKQISEK